MSPYYDTDLKVLWSTALPPHSRQGAGGPGRAIDATKIWHNRTDVCDICPVVLAREAGQPREAEIATPDGRIFFLRGIPSLMRRGSSRSHRVRAGYHRPQAGEEERGRLLHDLEVANHEANLYLDILTHDVRNANKSPPWYTDLLIRFLRGEPKMYVGR